MNIRDFKSYMIDVKAYSESEVDEIVETMKEDGTPIKDFLSEEEIAEAYQFTN